MTSDTSAGVVRVSRQQPGFKCLIFTFLDVHVWFPDVSLVPHPGDEPLHTPLGHQAERLPLGGQAHGHLLRLGSLAGLASTESGLCRDVISTVVLFTTDIKYYVNMLKRQGFYICIHVVNGTLTL